MRAFSKTQTAAATARRWPLALLCAWLLSGAVLAGNEPGRPIDALPVGLPTVLPVPDGNPLDPEVVELGRQMFFDPQLSVDRSVSCASCHQPDHGFSSPEPLPAGAAGRRATRHAPTLFNRGFGTSQMWDGRFATLEQQVLQPIFNENEMGLPLEQAIARLNDGPAKDRFEQAFSENATESNLSRALASYVRTLVLGGSPVDLFRAGDRSQLNESERIGFWLYESKGRCWRCHGGPNFSDEGFHNTGIGLRDGVPEEGRFAVTGRDEDRGAFKTPTLRGVAHTAPYMHDGSLATLRDVVEFYNRGGEGNSHLDQEMTPLGLSEEDVGHLVAFLEALSRSDQRER